MSDDRHIFVSVGSTSNSGHEAFVCAIEDRLRSEGMIPHTVNRNTFSSDAPLEAVSELLKTCSGAVVIALERSYFPSGVEKRGSPQSKELSEVKLPTAWNQIEAALAYSRAMPLLVVVERGLKEEGLLERGYNWYVQNVEPSPTALVSAEFNGIFSSWKGKVLSYSSTASPTPPPKSNVGDWTIGEILSSLKPAQLWSFLAALAAVVAGAFLVGAKLHGH